MNQVLVTKQSGVSLLEYSDIDVENSIVTIKLKQNDADYITITPTNNQNDIEIVLHLTNAKDVSVSNLKGRTTTQYCKSVTINKRQISIADDGEKLKAWIEAVVRPHKILKSFRKDNQQVLDNLKQMGVVKSAAPKVDTSRNLDLDAFIERHSKKSTHQKVWDEIAHQKQRQQLNTTKLTKSGNLSIAGKEVELCKAADIQLNSVLQHIIKMVGGDLKNLSESNTIKLMNLIQKLGNTTDVNTITKLTQNFINSLSK
ncbi:hypothetical protein P0J00_003456 [Vibrio vulnificus]|nr:hypothetical protein [Vibrio vulnificus]EKO5193460.1 hypothetical protein [Vibrio vulnificus]